MKIPLYIAAFLILLIPAACAPPTIPEDVSNESLIDVGQPFERGMMAYVRGDEELARVELQAAVKNNQQDQRASYLLCHLDNNNCYRQSQGQPVEQDQSAPDIHTVEQYLALVEGRSPQIRSSVYSIVEQKMILERKKYEVGPVLNVMLRFYPEAIFAMLTQRLVDLVEYPSEISRQNSFLLQRIASYINVKDDVLTRAFDSYTDYGVAVQQMHALKAELAAREHKIRITRLLIESGYAVKVTLVEAQAKRNKVLQQLESAQMRQLNYLQRMAFLAGIPIEQLTDLMVQHLVLPESDEGPTLRTGELEAIARQQYFNSLDVSDTTSVLSMTKVNLFSSYGKNFAEERETFVQGWSTGVRFQVPLMIWPMSNAKIAQQDAVIGQFQTQLELSLIQARNDWLDSYKRFTETSSLYVTAQSDTAIRKQRLQSQESARQSGSPGGRLKTIQAYISYYSSLSREYEAAARQQKAAFRWFRVQALSSQDIQFTVSELSREDSCQIESRYVYPPTRVLEISDANSFAKSDKASFLRVFANFNNVGTLVVPASSELLRTHENSYLNLLKETGKAGIPVLARVSLNGDLSLLPADQQQSLFFGGAENPGFSGVKFVLSHLPAPEQEKEFRSVLDSYRKAGLAIVVELDYSVLAETDSSVLYPLVGGADKLSIFLNPGNMPDTAELLDKLGSLVEKTYFTIDLGMYRGISKNKQSQSVENVVQENCRLFSLPRGLRELGIYSFEDYMALTPH